MFKAYVHTFGICVVAGASYVAAAYAAWRGIAYIEKKYPSGLIGNTPKKPDLRSVN